MILTKEQVEAIAARAEKATTLPWFAAPAATVQLAGDVPALIATVRELRKVLKLAQTCQHCIGAEMDACYRCEHEIPRRVREMLK